MLKFGLHASITFELPPLSFKLLYRAGMVLAMAILKAHSGFLFQIDHQSGRF